MNRKYLYPILIILATVILFYVENYVSTNEDSTLINEAGSTRNSSSSSSSSSSSEFNTTFLPTSTTGAIVKHNFFTLSYSEKYEQAEWVAYELSPKQLSKNEWERPYFVEDKSVQTKSADWRNYKNSGYDRGHLCPAGDRRFSFEAYNETFLTSNISPQNHDFNSGIWNRLEQKTRYWAQKYDGVYVITGGILKENLKTIGTEKVAVPEEFFKIIIENTHAKDTSIEGNYKVIAFLIPNEPSSKSIYDYTVSIDFIETKTGIDFFSKLPDSVTTILESTVDRKGW